MNQQAHLLKMSQQNVARSMVYQQEYGSALQQLNPPPMEVYQIPLNPRQPFQPVARPRIIGVIRPRFTENTKRLMEDEQWIPLGAIDRLAPDSRLRLVVSLSACCILLFLFAILLVPLVWFADSRDENDLEDPEATAYWNSTTEADDIFD